MGIDEFTVLAVVLHTGTHAAPHALVDCRVNAVVSRAHGGEIYVTSVLGMLG